MNLDDFSPFTTLIHQSPAQPIVILNGRAALRMAVVDKEAISLLESDWERPGVYLLLYPIGADGLFDIYVGKASTGGLRSRMLNHKNVKPGWIRSFLITRDTTLGYNSADVGWLEGRLWSLVKAAARARVVNGNQPGLENLPNYERATLELAIGPIRQVMRLLGYSLAPEDEATPVKTPGTKHYHGVKVLDLINAGLLTPGTTLELTWAGYEGAKAVVEADGRLLLDGVYYGTPSAAGAAARGGIVNGWEYWAIRDENMNVVSLAELRAKLPGTGSANGGSAQ
jgi:hypothetical protein